MVTVPDATVNATESCPLVGVITNEVGVPGTLGKVVLPVDEIVVPLLLVTFSAT